MDLDPGHGLEEPFQLYHHKFIVWPPVLIIISFHVIRTPAQQYTVTLGSSSFKLYHLLAIASVSTRNNIEGPTYDESTKKKKKQPDPPQLVFYSTYEFCSAN